MSIKDYYLSFFLFSLFYSIPNDYSLFLYEGFDFIELLISLLLYLQNCLFLTLFYMEGGHFRPPSTIWWITPEPVGLWTMISIIPWKNLQILKIGTIPMTSVFKDTIANFGIKIVFRVFLQNCKIADVSKKCFVRKFFSWTLFFNSWSIFAQRLMPMKGSRYTWGTILSPPM